MHEMRLHAPDDGAAREWHITERASDTALCGLAVSGPVADRRDHPRDAPPCTACLNAYRGHLSPTAHKDPSTCGYEEVGEQRAG